MNYLLLILLVISLKALAQEVTVPFVAPEQTAESIQQELQSTVQLVTANISVVSAGPSVVDCELVPTTSDVEKLTVATEPGPVCFTQNVSNDPLSVNPQPYTELPIGQHRRMTRDRNRFYQTGDYLLRRLEENHYQAVLNLNVVGANGLGEAMLNRIRGCIQQMNPHFKGEGGKRLEVVVLTTQEVNSAATIPENARPLQIDINVTPQPSTYRGNANEFGSNFSCKVIGHELLHHLGLCDEYHENPRDSASLVGNSGAQVNNAPTADQWSCRQVTTSHSYMRNITNAFNDVVPQNFTCQCDPVCQAAVQGGEPYRSFFFSQTLEQMVAAEDLDIECFQSPGIPNQGYATGTLPEDPENPVRFLRQENATFYFDTRVLTRVNAETMGYTSVQKTCDCSGDASGRCARIMSGIARRSSVRRNINSCSILNDRTPLRGPFIGNDGVTRVEGNTVIVNTTGNGESLLTPGQFDKILSGTCTGGSPQYERCAAFSNISRTNPACIVPTECSDDDYYLNNRPARIAPLPVPSVVVPVPADVFPAPAISQ